MTTNVGREPAVHVVYVAGTGRSGSTILANILGGVEGWFSAGEVRYLWERGVVENRLCGCGERFSDCPVWGRVMTATGAPGAAAVQRILHHQRGTGRARHAPRQVLRRLGVPTAEPSSEYTDVLSSLYGAVAMTAGARVIVDSSKLPAYGAVLAQVPGIRLSVVHLVRDPRAAAHSWQRRKEQPDRGRPGQMVPQGPVRSTLLWDLWNTSAEATWAGSPGYLRVRYEDFAADPQAVVRRIVTAVGEPTVALPFVGPRSVRLGVNHSVAGNPNRLTHGVVEVRADAEYRSAMAPRTYSMVTVLASPLLRHYGYPFRRHQAPADPARTIEVQLLPARRRLARRIGRHVEWARTQGIRRLVEEDQLNPVDRARAIASRARWRRVHAVTPGTAMPVFVVGVQRSGTNMLTRGLDQHPGFEVHNENDRVAFARFSLRDPEVIRRIVERSRHRHVLFKPLIDSHRIDTILDGLGTSTPARAIWAYRSVDGRVASALAKFGDNNLVVMREVAAGRAAERWQAQRITPRTMALIRSFDWEQLSATSAAAMFWYVRNELFFTLGLDRRDDVLLSSYEALLADPEGGMRRVAGFLDLPYEATLSAHIEPGRASRRRLDLDPVVREHCEELEHRLDEALQMQALGRVA